jgi:hypothetical protein
VQQGLAQVVLNASNFLRSHIVVLGVLVICAIRLRHDAWPRRLEPRYGRLFS